MQNAFEITPDDVLVVLLKHQLVSDIDDPLIEECFNALDFDAIVASALDGDDIDEQTNYALAAIESDLITQGLIGGPALLA
jgi:hypothetical protein